MSAETIIIIAITALWLIGMTLLAIWLKKAPEFDEDAELNNCEPDDEK